MTKEELDRKMAKEELDKKMSGLSVRTLYGLHMFLQDYDKKMKEREQQQKNIEKERER